MYIKINEGNHFGLVDIIGSMLENNNDFSQINSWTNYRDKLRRQFTVMAVDQCEILSLNINNLARMQSEFLEYYEELFDFSY